MKTITESEALSRVAFYCSSAEHCRYEVEEKFANALTTTTIPRMSIKYSKGCLYNVDRPKT